MGAFFCGFAAKKTGQENAHEARAAGFPLQSRTHGRQAVLFYQRGASPTVYFYGLLAKFRPAPCAFFYRSLFSIMIALNRLYAILCVYPALEGSAETGKKQKNSPLYLPFVRLPRLCGLKSFSGHPVVEFFFGEGQRQLWPR
jgi:hypothetical protein